MGRHTRRADRGTGLFADEVWEGHRGSALEPRKGTEATSAAGCPAGSVKRPGSGTRSTLGGPKGTPQKKENYMATGMTKTALTRLIAEKMEITNKQAASFLDLLAETAIKETKKNGVFVIPGIGRLVKAERKARIGRNPQTGAAIKIKAKTVVKFRVAKAAKDVIAPTKK